MFLEPTPVPGNPPSQSVFRPHRFKSVAATRSMHGLSRLSARAPFRSFSTLPCHRHTLISLQRGFRHTSSLSSLGTTPSIPKEELFHPSAPQPTLAAHCGILSVPHFRFLLSHISTAPFPPRTHNCGALSLSDAGNKVVLSGWLLQER